MIEPGPGFPGNLTMLFKSKLAEPAVGNSPTFSKEELLKTINIFGNQNLAKSQRNDLVNTLSGTITIEEYLQLKTIQKSCKDFGVMDRIRIFNRYKKETVAGARFIDGLVKDLEKKASINKRFGKVLPEKYLESYAELWKVKTQADVLGEEGIAIRKTLEELARQNLGNHLLESPFKGAEIALIKKSIERTAAGVHNVLSKGLEITPWSAKKSFYKALSFFGYAPSLSKKMEILFPLLKKIRPKDIEATADGVLQTKSFSKPVVKSVSKDSSVAVPKSVKPTAKTIEEKVPSEKARIVEPKTEVVERTAEVVEPVPEVPKYEPEIVKAKASVEKLKQETEQQNLEVEREQSPVVEPKPEVIESKSEIEPTSEIEKETETAEFEEDKILKKSEADTSAFDEAMKQAVDEAKDEVASEAEAALVTAKESLAAVKKANEVVAKAARILKDPKLMAVENARQEKEEAAKEAVELREKGIFGSTQGRRDERRESIEKANAREKIAKEKFEKLFKDVLPAEGKAALEAKEAEDAIKGLNAFIKNAEIALRKVQDVAGERGFVLEKMVEEEKERKEEQELSTEYSENLGAGAPPPPPPPSAPLPPPLPVFAPSSVRVQKKEAVTNEKDKGDEKTASIVKANIQGSLQESPLFKMRARQEAEERAEEERKEQAREKLGADSAKKGSDEPKEGAYVRIEKATKNIDSVSQQLKELIESVNMVQSEFVESLSQFSKKPAQGEEKIPGEQVEVDEEGMAPPPPPPPPSAPPPPLSSGIAPQIKLKTVKKSGELSSAEDRKDKEPLPKGNMLGELRAAFKGRTKEQLSSIEDRINESREKSSGLEGRLFEALKKTKVDKLVAEKDAAKKPDDLRSNDEWKVEDTNISVDSVVTPKKEPKVVSEVEVSDPSNYPQSQNKFRARLKKPDERFGAPKKLDNTSVENEMQYKLRRIKSGGAKEQADPNVASSQYPKTQNNLLSRLTKARKRVQLPKSSDKKPPESESQRKQREMMEKRAKKQAEQQNNNKTGISKNVSGAQKVDAKVKKQVGIGEDSETTIFP